MYDLMARKIGSDTHVEYEDHVLMRFLLDAHVMVS